MTFGAYSSHSIQIERGAILAIIFIKPRQGSGSTKHKGVLVSGEDFAHNNQNPNVSKSNWLHVVIFWVFFNKLELDIIDSSETISNFLEVLNSNHLILKLNQFICKQWSVLHVHRGVGYGHKGGTRDARWRFCQPYWVGSLRWPCGFAHRY